MRDPMRESGRTGPLCADKTVKAASAPQQIVRRPPVLPAEIRIVLSEITLGFGDPRLDPQDLPEEFRGDHRLDKSLPGTVIKIDIPRGWWLWPDKPRVPEEFRR